MLSLSERGASFKASSEAEDNLPLTFSQLSIIGYFYDATSSTIQCASCNFTRTLKQLAENEEAFITDHENHNKTCQTVKGHRLKTRSSLYDSGIGSYASGDEVRTHHPPTTTAPSTTESTKLYTSRSENKLPVPVKVKSNLGRLAADTVLVNSSGDNDNGTNTLRFKESVDRTKGPGNQVNRSDENQDSNQLKFVPKPSCRQKEYDTYEGRLATYYDWPKSSPMCIEELARAGFYYTHYGDKVKCPYCFGGVYNWEPTDTAFGEHVRHNPRCEFMKWVAYNNVTTPVPQVTEKKINKQVEYEDQPSVKAVLSLGYSLSLIQEVIGNKTSESITSEYIMDKIFEYQRLSKNKC